MIQCPVCHSSNRDTARFCATCAGPIVLIDRFRILRLVGQGGMGRVYQAEDLRLTGKSWAIKEMSDAGISDPVEKKRAKSGFKQESEILAQLNHPNILRVVDSFEQGDKHFIVTEFVDGSTLQQKLQMQGRPFLEAEVRSWLDQICSALSYLHAQRPPIIYRDLKPDNIMVDRGNQIKLIDFGIARFFQHGKSADTTFLGTPGYVAPEQYGRSQTDARSDIYALGVTLHQLLTGFDPTHSPHNLPQLRTRAPGVSPQMEQLVMRALAGRPQDRWQNIGELQSALQGGLAVIPTPQSSPFQKAGIPPGIQNPQFPNQLGAMHQPNRPTTRLMMAFVSFSNRQLAAMLVAIVLMVIVGMWSIGPFIQQEAPLLFYNVPLLVIAGPMAYAAVRRPWAACVTQFAVTLIGWTTWWLRSGGIPDNYSAFVLGVLLCSIGIEVGMRLLPWIRDHSSWESWQTEVAWFAVVASVSWFLFYSLLPGKQSFMPLGLWIGAALVGVAGWFFGDLIQQWLYLRKAGVRRLVRP